MNDTRICQDWKIYSRDDMRLFREFSLTRVFLSNGEEIKVTQNGEYPPLPPTANEVIVRVTTSKETPACPADRSCACLDADQVIDIPLKFISPLPQQGLKIYDLQFTPLPNPPKKP